jgi:hypothetical protein
MKRCATFLCCAVVGASLHAGGFGVGFQSAVPLGRGQAIVPRLDYLHATDSGTVATSAGDVDVSAKADVISLGADYDYFPGGRVDQGFYLLGGVGVAWAGLDVSGSGQAGAGSTTNHQVVPYPEAGVGYEFTANLGLELLYQALFFKDVQVQVGPVPVAWSFTSTVQLGLTVRF